MPANRNRVFDENDLRDLHFAYVTYPFSSLTQARAERLSVVAGIALLWAAGIVTETKQFLGFSIAESGFRVTAVALGLVGYATLQWILSLKRDLETRRIGIGRLVAKLRTSSDLRLGRASVAVSKVLSRQAKARLELERIDRDLATVKSTFDNESKLARDRFAKCTEVVGKMTEELLKAPSGSEAEEVRRKLRTACDDFEDSSYSVDDIDAEIKKAQAPLIKERERVIPKMAMSPILVERALAFSVDPSPTQLGMIYTRARIWKRADYLEAIPVAALGLASIILLILRLARLFPGSV